MLASPRLERFGADFEQLRLGKGSRAHYLGHEASGPGIEPTGVLVGGVYGMRATGIHMDFAHQVDELLHVVQPARDHLRPFGQVSLKGPRLGQHGLDLRDLGLPGGFVGVQVGQIPLEPGIDLFTASQFCWHSTSI